MNKFIVSVIYGSIIGFVKNNKIVEVEILNEKLKEYYDAYTMDFYYKIKEYLEGKDVLDELPYDIVFRNEFEKKVLTTLKSIKFGNVVSYKGLAILSGYPNAARAVGTVMAKNRLPLIFPCHRVIKSDGKIGNYGGGSHWKKYFLELEGVNIKEDKVISCNKL
ncbi:methylated-DNA--[protein]-cysteine S-methyltransferase [Marinitoga aeolica]|uniref:Methylated-DNA--protein-cysteine methyltransferase n=1 Tax=Marinitoga aeolica TaxID=2809031 RepID=A0ABY8PTE4_9BACT|nr:MGMT family protein [Marinitoga aeolica]WGS65902.1 methylated-DNA--[protein]-cysteine S-methyltransferase [Marinitoga aeolica]